MADPGDDPAFDEDKYEEDEEYRLSCHPSIKLWGDYGEPESLVGLKLELPFGHLGTCTGTVVGEAPLIDDEQCVAIEWTCGPAHDETLKAVLPMSSAVGFHLRGKALPSWMDDKHRRDLACPLFRLPPSAELIDWEMPDGNEAQYNFPDVFPDDPGERWWATMLCLNDPANAGAIQRSTRIKPYPTPLVLAILVSLSEENMDVKLPTVKDPAKQAMYDTADAFCRRLGAASDRGRTGYGQLAVLEKLAAREVPSGPFSCPDAWMRAYTCAEALLLTLSQAFEQAHDSWHFADDPARVSGAIASVVNALAGVLLHPPTPDTTQRIVDERDHLRRHLKAGSFVGIMEGDEHFASQFPEAAANWKLLLQVGETAGSSACVSTAAGTDTDTSDGAGSSGASQPAKKKRRA